VRDDVAADLGLPPGTQVVTGVPDLHAATVGSGAARLYEPHLSISTTGWISCPLPAKKTDALRAMATVPGIGDGNYVLANSIDTSGVCLEWARATLDAGDYPEMLDAAATSPPGSNGVVFTPWLGGTRSPAEDRNARAGWHGMSLQTTQADLVRAVLEGVACHGRWLHEAVEKLAKRRLEPIRLIGGGAQSDLWCQIHADVLDRKLERIADPASAVLRGGALLAAVALKAVEQAQLRDLVTVDKVFSPDPANREVYDRLFAEMPRLHKAQRGMSSRLRKSG
jgi:xylulokinase